MGLLERIFGTKKEPQYSGCFKLLNGYTPVFHDWRGCIYEAELCRAAIDAAARHSSKLQLTIQGESKPTLQTKLKSAPNQWQTWGQFLYRLRTILEVKNTAFIIPIIKLGEITGYTTLLPESWELVQVGQDPWIRFHFSNGQASAMEPIRLGIITKHQYRSDLFGDSNAPLDETMQLINIQRQTIEESAKNAASYKFVAKVNNFTKTEDLRMEQERFSEENFQKGGGGVLLFPNTYNDIKQINMSSFALDAEQMKLIQTNVFNYFGVNEAVLQNAAYGDAFSAFYEGSIEPFAVQLSDVMTQMTFTERERGYGSRFFFTANRLQFMTNADKLNVSTQLVDRGLMSLNEAREIWNLPPVDDGDNRIIRGEYYSTTDKLDEEDTNESES